VPQSDEALQDMVPALTQAPFEQVWSDVQSSAILSDVGAEQDELVVPALLQV